MQLSKDKLENRTKDVEGPMPFPQRYQYNVIEIYHDTGKLYKKSGLSLVYNK